LPVDHPWPRVINLSRGYVLFNISMNAKEVFTLTDSEKAEGYVILNPLKQPKIKKVKVPKIPKIRIFAKIKANCKRCGAEFTTYPSLIAKGSGKYCGRACSAASMRGVPMAKRIAQTSEPLAVPA
jgi:hypothetical protein